MVQSCLLESFVINVFNEEIEVYAVEGLSGKCPFGGTGSYILPEDVAFVISLNNRKSLISKNYLQSNKFSSKNELLRSSKKYECDICKIQTAFISSATATNFNIQNINDQVKVVSVDKLLDERSNSLKKSNQRHTFCKECSSQLKEKITKEASHILVSKNI